MRGSTLPGVLDNHDPVMPKQDDVLATLHDWLADPATIHNATVLLVAGLVFTNEEDYVEALKALHAGESLEM